MRRYSPTYFVSQALKGMKRNGMMTLASVTVLLSCLVVMGCFSMLLINIEKNLDSLGEMNEIVAFVYSDVKYKQDDTRPTPNVPNADGNTFLGWSLDPDSDTPQYSAGQSYTVNASDSVCGDITLYAVWQNKVKHDGVTVIYNTSGIELAEEMVQDTTVYKTGDKITFPTNVSARNPARKFLGWTLDLSLSGETITAKTYPVKDEDVHGGKLVFYAVWDEMPVYNEYSISYDLNGVAVEGDYSDSALILNYVHQSLTSLKGIDKINYISKSDALEEEIKKYEDYPGLQDFLKEENNPLPDTYIVTYKSSADIAALELKIQNIDGVSRVKCRSDIAENIESLKNGIILVFSWFMIILFAVSVFVIINTIKLAVAHRTEEISIMRYIGATKWFIALPFMLEGIIIGAFAGIISFFLQWYAYGYIQDMIMSDMKMIAVVPFSNIGVLLFIGCLVVGVFTGFLGSQISIRKHLND